MDKKAKESYRQLIQPRYRRAKKKIKQRILDEFCTVCGYNRKYAIGLLQKPVRQRPKAKHKAGRKPVYHDPALLKVLWRIWLETELACGKRLKVAIPLWLPFYAKHYGVIDEQTQHRLLNISSASIDRALKPMRDKLTLKRPCGTRPGSLWLKQQIPIKDRSFWDVTQPGFVEADTVAHCGNTLKGNFAWSLTVTDIKTTWTEIRAIWNKGAYEVTQQTEAIEQALPFPLLGYNSDSGAEFLNHHLVRYFAKPRGDRIIKFSRSRPYKKNDNAHVEQKNWTHVRQLFGYGRFDKPGVVPMMNNLYGNEWRLFQNFFMPSLKLVEKTRIGARYYRKYDTPKTPYQRALNEPGISKDQKQQLTAIYQTLDPFQLRKQIVFKRKQIIKYIQTI
jgi:hypothetical protein